MTTRVLKAEEIEFDYDAEQDILYVSVGDRGSAEAVTYETDEGHLVRVDAETHELVGATILDYRECWEGKPLDLQWEPDESPSRRRWLRHHSERQRLVLDRTPVLN